MLVGNEKKRGHLDPRVFTKKACKSSNFFIWVYLSVNILSEIDFLLQKSRGPPSPLIGDMSPKKFFLRPPFGFHLQGLLTSMYYSHVFNVFFKNP